MEDALLKAKESGRYALAVWYLVDGKVNCWCKTYHFPIHDFPVMVDTLKMNLDQQAPGMFTDPGTGKDGASAAATDPVP